MSIEITFRASGEELKGLLWAPEGEPVGIVQLVHGMAEHIRRYDDFARYLNQFGYVVAGHDHPGHGLNMGPGIPGDFGPRGWAGVVQCTGTVGDELRKRYPGIPMYLLGHSMGSFVVRCLIHLKPMPLNGLIITGTGSASETELSVCHRFVGLDEVVRGPMKPAETCARLQSLNFSRLFPEESPFNWLSTNEEQVRCFEQDPWCGFAFPARSFRQMLGGMQWAGNLERKARHMTCPVLMASGAEDPVGHRGKDPMQIFSQYQRITDSRSRLILYPGMRHEILNETQRNEVYQDIVGWIETIGKGQTP